jgi:hypothetical protein
METLTIFCDMCVGGVVCGRRVTILHQHVEIRGAGAGKESNVGDHEIHYMVRCPCCGIRTFVTTDPLD